MIDTIIFDYGKVLAYPVTGMWFSTPETRKLLGNLNYLKFTVGVHREKAFKLGHKLLNEKHILHTEDEEISLFTEYYSLVLNELDICDKNGEKAKLLAEDITLNDGKIALYNDALIELEKLKKDYRILMLTDNWPSVRRVLVNTGLSPLLDGLLISCDYNECKTSTKLFEIAINEWKLTPQNALFIDDSAQNLKNALKVGLNPVLMDRSGKITESEFPIITKLNEIYTLLHI